MPLNTSIKSDLISKLKQEHSFWSYDESCIDSISDDILIEKALIHLDLTDINQLFKIYSLNKVKKVWRDHLIPQEEYLHTLNRFLAWFYFKIKDPDRYLKSMTTRYYNKLTV